jgi:hypothetical protein
VERKADVRARRDADDHRHFDDEAIMRRRRRGSGAAFVSAIRGVTSLTTDGTTLVLQGTTGVITFRIGVGIGG